MEKIDLSNFNEKIKLIENTENYLSQIKEIY